jgi:hypothetical protein
VTYDRPSDADASVAAVSGDDQAPWGVMAGEDDEVDIASVRKIDPTP